MREERVSEFEIIPTEIIQSEEQRGKKLEKMKNIVSRIKSKG